MKKRFVVLIAVVARLVGFLGGKYLSGSQKTGGETEDVTPEEVPSYTDRRLQPLPGELSMETTTAENRGEGNFGIYYTYQVEEGEDFLTMWVEDESKPGKILIKGQEYPYSFGNYTPRGGENPQVCLLDINGDSEPDVLMRGEAYRAQIRQEVYLSDGEGGYKELGDVTWQDASLEKFPFTVTYEDDYKIHITMPDYGIEETVEMQTSFLELVQELGIYDADGRVTDLGKHYIETPSLQSQAVRYMQAEDGAVTLRYEAQLESGYSEYCLGWCFVFTYAITDEGYVLQDVTLEKFPY